MIKMINFLIIYSIKLNKAFEKNNCDFLILLFTSINMFFVSKTILIFKKIRSNSQ